MWGGEEREGEGGTNPRPPPLPLTCELELVTGSPGGMPCLVNITDLAHFIMF